MTIKHTDSTFASHDGTKIFHQGWMPENDRDVKGVVAIIHGYGEHGGRYAHVGEFLASKGFHVEAMDHRGHGRTEGKDTFFKSVDDCVGDVDIFVDNLAKSRPGKPVFVLGHSMGGLITAHWAIDRQPKVNGVLLSGPAVMLDESIPPLLVKLSGVIGKVAPRLKTITLDGGAVSRDPAVVEKYNSDPLNYRGGIPAATGAAMNRSITHVHENLEKLTLPVRIMYGTSDKLADPRGSEALYAGSTSKDKTLVPYEGLYHEILNEPEQEQVMAECLEWISERI